MPNDHLNALFAKTVFNCSYLCLKICVNKQRAKSHLPSMLGSPSSRERMYLLRKSVQKLKKYQSARKVRALEFHTPASASITVVSVMVIFRTGSPGVLSLRANITRS